MKSYISYLLDHHSKINKSIEIECKSEILAKKASNFLNVAQFDSLVKGDFYEIFDQVRPIEKYKEYHSVYFDEMRRIEICGEKDDEYIAAAFDLDSSFKHNKKEDKTYPIVTFRKKTIKNDIINFVKKSYKNDVIIQGRDLLFILERLKKHLIIRSKHADLFIDCLMEPDNPYYSEALENYTKNKN